jgi:hypothetical protein
MIIVDKISSSTKNIPLTHQVRITKNIISAEGYVLAVEILSHKKNYNQIELTSGRMSTIHKGERLLVTLGERRALKGFVGQVPKKLKAGDTINILNIGGVSGHCISENYQNVGHAAKAKVLGQVLNNKGKRVNIRDYRLFNPANHLSNNIPLILVSGTCMDVGKTTTACEIIKMASRAGFRICSAKVAGIAALKDTLRMEDNGSIKAVTIVDGGVTSTASKKGIALKITKGAINFLACFKPDYIVIELGDGILGEYGVIDIMRDKEIQALTRAHVGCANDPPGAIKLFEISKDLGIKPALISGPVTDNSVGTRFIKKNLHLTAINSLTHGEEIFSFLNKKCLRFKRDHLQYNKSNPTT